MSVNRVQLFVMPGCQVCPQMERLFEQMHQQGAIDELQVYDLQQHPEMAQQYHIRSVPHYLINGIAFTGLKSLGDINHLLQQDDSGKWESLISDELSSGQLDSVEKRIRQQPDARNAMIALLKEHDTPLVVRIGLTAIIETLAESGLLIPFEDDLIEMTRHVDERIAIDAMYYLSLLGTTRSLKTLTDIAEKGAEKLRHQALELLEDVGEGKSLH